MKLCDKCERRVNSLITLTDQYDSMEVCSTCHEELDARIKEIASRVCQVHARARSRAFKAWLGRDYKPPAVRESYAFVTHLLRVFMWSRTTASADKPSV